MPRPVAILLLLALAATADADTHTGRLDAPRLEANATAIMLSQDDMDATYNALFSGGLALSLRISDHTRLGLGLGYGRREGNPYADDDGFTGDLARVTSVPLSVSLRTSLVRGRSVDLVGGLDLQYAWLEERLPTGHTTSGLETFDGGARGFVVSLGPSWTVGGRHVLSLDMALGGVSGEVRSGTRRHEVDLRGLHLRLGYAVALGAPEAR